MPRWISRRVVPASLALVAVARETVRGIHVLAARDDAIGKLGFRDRAHAGAAQSRIVKATLAPWIGHRPRFRRGDANATAAAPPSSAAMRFSSTSFVGFMMRL